jgi:hypothetical protein
VISEGHDLPIGSLLPSDRIKAGRLQLLALPTNGGVTTAFCFALSASSARPRDPPMVPLGKPRPLSGDSNLGMFFDFWANDIGALLDCGGPCEFSDWSKLHRDVFRYVIRMEPGYFFLRCKPFPRRGLKCILHGCGIARSFWGHLSRRVVADSCIKVTPM